MPVGNWAFNLSNLLTNGWWYLSKIGAVKIKWLVSETEKLSYFLNKFYKDVYKLIMIKS